LARSAALHDGRMRDIIHAFKYGGRRTLAHPLADLMREAGASVLQDCDALVPVPLHPWRTLSRGFNQADDLAIALRLPVWRVLQRHRRGTPQVSLTRRDRLRSARGAFCLRRKWGFRAVRQQLRGASVVLIDDVMTTGATVDACGRVLLDAGVTTVRVLTVARAAASLRR